MGTWNYCLILTLLLLAETYQVSSADSHYCTGSNVIHEFKTCPDPDKLDIIAEMQKPDTDSRFDFAYFTSQGISSDDGLRLTIKKMIKLNQTCPYVRKEVKTICCSGWSGTGCDSPDCNPKCKNNGTCVGPNTCNCTSPWDGELCQFDQNSPDLGYCYFEQSCNDTKANTKLYSKNFCCSYLNGTSFGRDGSCVSCDQHKNSLSNVYYPKTSPVFSTCMLWGLFHFQTFDGLNYVFDGTCEYKLAGNANWKIYFEPTGCDKWGTCQKTLSMTFGLSTIVAQGKRVDFSYNDEPTYRLGDAENYYPSNTGISIMRRNSFTYLRYSDGVAVEWDQDMTVYITIDKSYEGQTDGLCGFYNDDATDDLKMKTGEITDKITEFADSWRTTSCALSNELTNPCSNVDLTYQAQGQCNLLVDTSDAFGVCVNQIDSYKYYWACMWDYCTAVQTNSSLELAKCTAYEAMSRECVENFLNIPWRTKDRCPKTCDNGKVYTECASTCEVTCYNRNQDVSQQCSNDCNAGCVCPSNTFQDLSKNNTCVPIEECSCFYKNKYYAKNDKVMMDCNECECLNGTWICEQNRCPRTCSIYGVGHLETFDGYKYTINGAGVYVVLENFNETLDNFDIFRIEYTIDYSKTDVQDHVLTIIVYGNMITLTKNEQYFNEKLIKSLPYNSEGIHIIQSTSEFISVIADGFTVLFNGVRVYITLKEKYIGSVKGLCGTFNYVTNDDLTASYNIIEDHNLNQFADSYKMDLTKPTSALIDPCSRVANTDYNICEQINQHNCEIDPLLYISNCKYDLCVSDEIGFQNRYLCEAMATYAFACAKINSTVDWLADSTFRTPCFDSKFGVCKNGQIFQDCSKKCYKTCKDLSLQFMGDYCTNQCVQGCDCPDGYYMDDSDPSNLECVPVNECKCYDMYTNQFFAPNSQLNKKCSNCTCINGQWNCTNQICNEVIECSKGQVFTKNASSCEKTCFNYHNYRPCDVVEMCACPNGQVLRQDTDVCVNITDCPCMFDKRLYEDGSILDMKCKTCKCDGGNWICDEKDCQEDCFAVGDPHYKTFDGEFYQFEGNCKYLFAGTKDGELLIYTENIPCGTTGQTCTKSVDIMYKGLRISLMRGLECTVNNVTLEDAPFYIKYYLNDVTIIKIGFYIIVNTTNAMLRWDGATRVVLTARSALKGNMIGLCGNYDGDVTNDKTDSKGATWNDWAAVADSYKISASCPPSYVISIDENNPCVGKEQRQVWAASKCSIILNANSDNPFQQCIINMDVNILKKYYTQCMFDSCK